VKLKKMTKPIPNHKKNAKKINIMQITHDLGIGGLQQVVVNLCKTLDKKRFNVKVLCLRGLGDYVDELKNAGIEIFCIEKNFKHTDYFTFLKIAKILRKNKTDIVHTHNTQPLIEGTLGALLSGVKTIIHTDHARKFPDKRRYMIAEWIASKFVKKIVGVSQETIDDLVKFERISQKKCTVIFNGIVKKKFHDKIDTVFLKKSLGIHNDSFIIGVCARLSEQKGLSYLINSMPYVLSHFPQTTLVIVGDGILFHKLKDESEKLGISENVVFCGKRLDIPEILQIFDLYVLPSLWEGLPIGLIEAMASGCPIIATNVGGNKSIICSGDNGVLVEPKDSDTLALEILNLLKNPNLRSLYSKRGIEKFNNNFDSKIMTDKYINLYLSN
jgi:glycosyltransferase involved in cell wall biosynthesis